MADDLWGAIGNADWRTVPHVAGRLATEEDAKAGRAVYYQEGEENVRMEPFPISLPHPAILKADGASEAVIVVQVEHAAEQVLVGYRNLGGGNGIATLDEVEFLDEPDGRFWRS